ncbi:hypothetical protein VNO77_25153 [Canavalia gladiata]|uniref:Uncharacterized protein n=1 Tax=Canavalia gladiata TaxID=3824 RepID=A0AAN9QD98_CANGL
MSLSYKIRLTLVPCQGLGVMFSSNFGWKVLEERETSYMMNRDSSLPPIEVVKEEFYLIIWKKGSTKPRHQHWLRT